jgi:hypothetical protein
MKPKFESRGTSIAFWVGVGTGSSRGPLGSDLGASPDNHCLHSNSNDPDMPMFHQAMRSPDQEYWLEAMQAELSDLHTRETWIEMDRNDLPEGANVVPGTWAFKVKRYPDG